MPMQKVSPAKLLLGFMTGIEGDVGTLFGSASVESSLEASPQQTSEQCYIANYGDLFY